MTANFTISGNPGAALRAESPYGYIPTEWIGILFVVLFAVSAVTHLAQSIHSRLWWLIPTAVLAAVAEVLGWVARTESSKNPGSLTAFQIQIIVIIIAPTPLIAANFVILGEIISRLGQQYSRLSAKWYTIIFCTADVVALIVQGIGGAKASLAVQHDKNPQPGARVMLAGIVFQLVFLSTYLCLAIEFLLRYHYDKPIARKSNSIPPKSFAATRNIKFMIFGLACDGLFLLIRSIYRTAELADGWNGVIILTQVYFNVFDAAMIVLATYAMNIFHPGRLLGKANTWSKKNREPSVESGDLKA